MSDQATNALLAIGLGTLVAIVLLVPVAAYQYRLDGRLQASDLAILLSGAVYGLALWTYTLLPVPPAGEYDCKGRQLDPLGSLGAVDLAGPATLLRDPAFLQVALNVLLFVPLGYYVRQILGRGVVVATLLGLGISLLPPLTVRRGHGVVGLRTEPPIGRELLAVVAAGRTPPPAASALLALLPTP